MDEDKKELPRIEKGIGVVTLPDNRDDSSQSSNAQEDND